MSLLQTLCTHLPHPFPRKRGAIPVMREGIFSPPFSGKSASENNTMERLHRNPRDYKKASVPVFGERNALVIGSSARLRQTSARNSVNRGSSCQDSKEMSMVFAQQCQRGQATSCRPPPPATAQTGRPNWPVCPSPPRHPPQEEKLLPSSPRRLTSSCDRALCCFSASSRCGRQTSGYSGCPGGPFQGGAHLLSSER